MRLKVPILAILWRFGAFLKLPVLVEAFEIGRQFFIKIQSNLYTFTWITRFLNDSNRWAKNQYNSDQIFKKSLKIGALVWPLQNADFSSNYQKDLNLVSVWISMTCYHQVYLVKSYDLALILWAVLYFTDQLFAAYYRLLCKRANLWVIDLKFSKFIFDVNGQSCKIFVT